ncbi:MAG: hypothetical protein ACYDBB_06050 [Armatimonadota bacterium]
MARVKVTASDIHARLARGECANYRNNSCQDRTPCTVVNGEPCDYFAKYVQPLLEYPEFSTRYGREAKVTLALNPKAKVIRKRRTASEPALALDNPAVPAAAEVKKPTPLTTNKVKSTTESTAKPVVTEKPVAATHIGKVKAGKLEQAVPQLASKTPTTAAHGKRATAKSDTITPGRATRGKAQEKSVTTVVTVKGDVKTKSATTKRAAVPTPLPPAYIATVVKESTKRETTAQKTPREKVREKPITTVVTATGTVVTKPAATRKAVAAPAAVAKVIPSPPAPKPPAAEAPAQLVMQLVLEMTPATPAKRSATRRR